MIKRMARGILVYTVLGGVIGYTLAGPDYLFGIFLGGLFAYLNLVWISGIVRGILTGVKSKKRFALSLVSQTLSAYLLVGVLIHFELVLPQPFIIGLTGLVVSVFIVGLRWRSTLG